jgi:hypothetical protein
MLKLCPRSAEQITPLPLLDAFVYWAYEQSS